MSDCDPERDVLIQEDGTEWECIVIERNKAFIVIRIDDEKAGKENGMEIFCRLPQ